MTVTQDSQATPAVDTAEGAQASYGPGIDPERLAVCLSVLEELDKLEVDHPDAVAVRRPRAPPAKLLNRWRGMSPVRRSALRAHAAPRDASPACATPTPPPARPATRGSARTAPALAAPGEHVRQLAAPLGRLAQQLGSAAPLGQPGTPAVAAQDADHADKRNRTIVLRGAPERCDGPGDLRQAVKQMNGPVHACRRLNPPQPRYYGFSRKSKLCRCRATAAKALIASRWPER